MRLTEQEGKEFFRKYGIAIPNSALITTESETPSLAYPLMLKSQVHAGERKKKGGIKKVNNLEEFRAAQKELFLNAIDGELPSVLLAEELIDSTLEFYASFSYSSEHRAPVLALSKNGGTGIGIADIFSVDVILGPDDNMIDTALTAAEISPSKEIKSLIKNLWKLFTEEHLLLAEINPLFVLVDGSVVAGDAKVVRDDALLENIPKPFVSLGGDIAIIASGGGASMLNIDILMKAGGKPANYVEYSGNPPASVVEELTLRVLSQPGIRGLWVIGGTANFTDIYETMMGFVAGLRLVNPKPEYPIVIRRDGPRQNEAKEMLLDVAAREGYGMHIYGPELSMSESALKLLEIMK